MNALPDTSNRDVYRIDKRLKRQTDNKPVANLEDIGFDEANSSGITRQGNAFVVSGGGGGGGSLQTNDTLSGVGTAQSPLQVADNGIGVVQLDADTDAKKTVLRNYIGAIGQDEASIKGTIDVNSNTTLSATAEDYLIRVTTGSNNVTITLPASSSVDNGFDIWIRKADGGSGNVIIAAPGNDTIDGSSNNYEAITDRFDTAHLVLTGIDWDVVGGELGHPNDIVSVADSGTNRVFTHRNGTTTVLPRGGAANNTTPTFRTENGSNANNPGLTFFIKADNTEWQSGSSSQVVSIEIHNTQLTSSQNPQIDNAAFTAWHSLPENIIANRGKTIWRFQRIANDSPFSPLDGQVVLVEVGDIVKNSDGNYVLQNLKHLHDFSLNGTGFNWEVTGIFAPPTGAPSVEGVLGKSQLPSDVVYTENLTGKETDIYFSYTNAATDYWTGTIKFFNQSSGAPDNSNLIRQPDIAAGTITVGVGRPRTDRDPNHFVQGNEQQASDYAVGDVFYLSDWNDANTGGVLTLTSGGTVVGTGSSRYIYFTATLSNVTNELPDVADNGDYWRFAKEEPTKISIDIPASDVINPPWLTLD